MENIYFDNKGLIHLIFAILSLMAGSLVLYLPKGTKQHKQIGYVYSVCMIVMLGSSMMIYRLFKGFGIFHIASIVSIFYLFMGMYAAMFNRKNKSWAITHFRFMYWSVVGLYAAFAAEVSVRVPKTPFFAMVGIGTMSVVVLGIISWRKNKKKWKKQWIRD